MLALASLLERLRDDPGTVGKRYQLTAQLDPARLPAVRGAARRGATPAPRYSVDAADSFRLGEPLRLVAYPGDHTRFEAPPLAAGRRLRGPDEVEVGLGLADALGLRPGSTLAAQLPGGGEVRFRVAGVVRALENDGRIAWVRAATGCWPPTRGLQPAIVVRLTPAPTGRASTRGCARSARAPHARRRRDQTATPASSACSPRCCAASGWRSGSCACTRSSRRWR